MPTAIRKPAKYIAELFRIIKYDPRTALADDDVFSRVHHIFYFSVAKHPASDNYWLAWGGWFDNPIIATSYGLQIFMDVFLTEVFNTTNLLSIVNSFYVDVPNSKVYIHLPRNPFRYFQEYSAVYDNTGSTFSTAPKSDINLSDIRYGVVRAEPRMDVPKLNNKLSDTISGISVYNAFKIKINNADGKYDGMNITEYFNTPLQISKTTEDAETIEQFNRVRNGIVNDIEIDFQSIIISATDQFYQMKKEYCRPITTDLFPFVDEGNINNLMPIGFGRLYRVELIEVNKDVSDPAEWIDYIALDPLYMVAVHTVYDQDGNSLSFSFDATTKIIRVTELDDDGEVIEGVSADIDGLPNNSIGEIIIHALIHNENIPYEVGIWDVDETQRYLDICPTLSFYFDGGTTKDLIEAVLKNDMAYLIQKNNGLLTLRRWGLDYDTHTIESWLVTKEPKKDFKDAAKYYCSTVKILHDKYHADDEFKKTYLYDYYEATIFEKYRKSFTAEIECDIDNMTDIESLAERMIQRFGQIRETIKIGVGYDTYAINLLDKVTFICNINNRDFSSYATWIVKEADPGQDEIVIEGDDIAYYITFDGKIALVDNKYLITIKKEE